MSMKNSEPPSKRRSATIEDVARLAEVSIKTVSRVVNSEPNVRAVTRDRVEKAIAELEYRPNPSARGLAGNRSHKIALIYEKWMAGSNYVVDIQQGILQRCQDIDYELLIHTLEFHPQNLPGVADAVARFARHSRIDGLLIAPPFSDCKEIIHELDRMAVPHVLLSPGVPPSGALCVTTNDLQASAAMTDHLIALGHTRIAYLGGLSTHKAVAQREEGFRLAVARAGLSVDERLCLPSDSTFKGGVCAARELFRADRLPTAVFAATDDMAAGVLSVAHEMKISVPGAVSVSGYDDSAIAHQVWPPLTTVRQPILEMAEVAVDLLWKRLRGASSATNEVVLSSELVVRDSTALKK